MSKPVKKLTEVNKRFVELIVSGECSTATDAFLQTRTTKMSRSNATREASRLWGSVPAQEYAERLRQGLQAKRQRRIAGEQDAVRRRLWIEATPIGDAVEELHIPGARPVLGQGAKASDRVAALRLIGQASAMFIDKLVVEEPDKSRAEMLAEIQSLLGLGSDTAETSEPEAPASTEGSTVH